jgi:cysteine synthase A
MKERLALAAISAAEADGRLRPGGTVIEYTGGTTGVSLAFVCAAKGYKSRIVFSDAFSQDKGLMMQVLGSPLFDPTAAQATLVKYVEVGEISFKTDPFTAAKFYLDAWSWKDD